jgi:hypothetical protein
MLFAGCNSDNNDPQGNEGIVAGMAAGKFCHQLNRSGRSIDLTLEFGTPALTRLTASTGTCSPPIGQLCQRIPVGIVPSRLLEGDKVLATGRFTLLANREYVFFGVVSASTGQPSVNNGELDVRFKCSTINPLTPTDGGAMDAAEAGVPDGGDGGVDGAPDAGAIDTAGDAGAEVDAPADASPDAPDDTGVDAPDDTSADVAENAGG